MLGSVRLFVAWRNGFGDLRVDSQRARGAFEGSGAVTISERLSTGSVKLGKGSGLHGLIKIKDGD
jgi:hypothetical protein